MHGHMSMACFGGVQKRILSIGPCLPPCLRQNFLFYSCIHQANWQLSFRGCPVSASCLIIGTLEWETYATILWSTVALAWQTPYLYPQVLYFFLCNRVLWNWMCFYRLWNFLILLLLPPGGGGQDYRHLPLCLANAVMEGEGSSACFMNACQTLHLPSYISVPSFPTFCLCLFCFSLFNIVSNQLKL